MGCYLWFNVLLCVSILTICYYELLCDIVLLYLWLCYRVLLLWLFVTMRCYVTMCCYLWQCVNTVCCYWDYVRTNCECFNQSSKSLSQSERNTVNLWLCNQIEYKIPQNFKRLGCHESTTCKHFLFILIYPTIHWQITTNYTIYIYFILLSTLI
jgi:hypothetical protein